MVASLAAMREGMLDKTKASAVYGYVVSGNVLAAANSSTRGFKFKPDMFYTRHGVLGYL